MGVLMINREANVPTMKSFQQVKGKETHELKQLYNNLQQYWDTLKKQSNQTKPSRTYSSPSNNATIKAIQLENHSPRYLMSMLQQDPSEAWMMRTNDAASREILRDRWEAIESGKFKGRRLFVPMEEEECESDHHRVSSNCEEVRSVSSFCYSEDDEHESSGSKGQQQRECFYSSSSTSTCCVLGGSDHVDKDMVAIEADQTRVVANRGSSAVWFGGFAFAFLLLVAMCMSGGSDCEVILVPT